MSNTDHTSKNKTNIKRRALSEPAKKYKTAPGAKAGIKNTGKARPETGSRKKVIFVQAEDVPSGQGKPAAAAAAGTKQASSAPKTQPAAASASAPEPMPGPDLIRIRPEEPPASSRNLNWALIIPAIVVVLCLAMFVVASQAGWIQTFLTPESRLVRTETTTPETTAEPQTTTAPPETTTETTTEETTTEFIPSYYVIDVNLAYNIVTVYTRGEKLNDGYDPKDPYDDQYDLIPTIAFTCSPGVNGATPTGTYYLQERSAWCLMEGDVYTQYATRVVDAVMFHSVPYYSENPGDLETYEYNILGYEASSACIRLCARDASWIFYNCAMDTEVNIFYDYENYGPLDPEPIYRIPEDLDPLSKWDPTDYNAPGNPWFSYSPVLSYDHVTLPCYSSVDALLRAIGPTDEYGNDLSEYFYTDGGYSLETPGTYNITGYISIATLDFSFPITIVITDEIADEEYYYEEEYEEDDSEDEYADEYSEEEYAEGGEEGYEDDAYYASADDGGDTGYEDTGYEDTGYEDTGYEEGWEDPGYSEDYADGGYAEEGYEDTGYEEGGYDEGGYDEGGYDEAY